VTLILNNTFSTGSCDFGTRAVIYLENTEAKSIALLYFRVLFMLGK